MNLLLIWGVRIDVCPGVGPKRWLRWFGLPFGWCVCVCVCACVCSGHAQYPVFAPDTLFLYSRLFKTGSWGFWSLSVFWVQHLLQLSMHTVIFSFLRFLCTNI